VKVPVATREEGEDDREEAEEFWMIVEGMPIDCERVRLGISKDINAG